MLDARQRSTIEASLGSQLSDAQLSFLTQPLDVAPESIIRTVSHSFKPPFVLLSLFYLQRCLKAALVDYSATE
ncbi:hypothetical protein [Streptomyces aquilus]|uniref:hypothetical protein n=1 Tax=Streptomyces aquilus TaxID=2548456 RepID=UPI00369ECB44